MGYTTTFNGSLEIYPPPPLVIVEYINQFSSTRRMKRKVDQKFGVEGEFYCLSTEDHGQRNESNIIAYNDPPATQPSLWCQWIIENNSLIWDGQEKFYHYNEWLSYLINNFFNPYDLKLNGEILWSGEESDDIGKIVVKDNKILILYEKTEVETDLNDEKIWEAQIVLQGGTEYELINPISKNKLNFEELLKF